MTRNRMYARKSRPAVPWYGGVGELNRLVVGGLVVDIVMAVAAPGTGKNATPEQFRRWALMLALAALSSLEPQPLSPATGLG